jgi:hypothetical protein
VGNTGYYAQEQIIVTSGQLPMNSYVNFYFIFIKFDKMKPSGDFLVLNPIYYQLLDILNYNFFHLNHILTLFESLILQNKIFLEVFQSKSL